MKFMLVCGGTAGHINPAIAVADALRSLLPGCGIRFVGAGRPMEQRLVPSAGYELENIEMHGLARGIKPHQMVNNAKAAAMLLAANVRAEKLIKSYEPDAVIGTGGYICYPMLKAAVKRDIPTVMLESNAVPGMTTKLLSAAVTRVYTAFPGQEALYKKPERVFVLGTPVRSRFLRYTRERARRELEIDDGLPVVLSFFGSLGAARMNERMESFIRRNIAEKRFHHIHSVGSEAGVNAMINAVADGQMPDFEDLRPYIDDMARVMAAADIVICRAGGSTLAELSALGRAAVLIPSPNVTNDHQTAGAREISEAGGALMVRDADCTGDTLYEAVMKLLSEPEEIARMEACQRAFGSANAAAQLAGEIISLL